MPAPWLDHRFWRRPVSWPDRGLAALVVGLGAVFAVRASGNILGLCLLASLGLGGLLAQGGRTWLSVVMTPVALLIQGLRALPWGWRGLRSSRRMPAAGVAWIRGAVVAAALVWLIVALLASADGAFAGLLSRVLPTLELESLPTRIVIGVLTAMITLAMAFAAAVPPRWPVLRGRRRVGPVAEWLLPVLAVAVVLAVFLAVQAAVEAAVLFDAYPAALVEGGATPAERARQGFGQLVLVTLVVAVLLGWAARRCDPARSRHRRLLAGGAAPCWSWSWSSSPPRCAGSGSTRRPSAGPCCGSTPGCSSCGSGR